MVEFTLFGVPVRIHPLHWLGLAIIGGIIGVSSPGQLFYVALFMIAGFLGILAHEMGHALTGRKLGNAGAAITLVFFGGYTQYFHPQFTRNGRALSILAGPGATVLIGILAFLIYCFFFQNVPDALTVSFYSAFSPYWIVYANNATYISEGQQAFLYFNGCLIFIAFWWTLLNMLPIMPMDGGQFLAQYVKSPRRVHLVGFVTSLLVLAFSLWSGSTLLTFFMIYMGFENFRAMKQAPF